MALRVLCLFFFSAIGFIHLSFKRSSTYLNPTVNVYLYYTFGFNTSPAGEFLALIQSAATEMSPSGLTTSQSPFIYSGGLSPSSSGTPPIVNTYSELGYGYYYKADALMVTTRLQGNSSISGTHGEMDLLVNSNFNEFSYWGNGYNNTYDRETVLKHELGHGVGLSHSTKSPLMNESTPKGYITGLKDDDIAGYKCIYDGVCTGEEGSGDVSLSTNVVELKAKTYFQWHIESSYKTVKGFNLLKKDCHTNEYISLNNAEINCAMDNNYYAFCTTDKLNFSTSIYFLEIVYENGKTITPFEKKGNKQLMKKICSWNIMKV
ncbi:MAG TPA: matrixin family metalloprotease [Bacteroidia bacterium]|nr:matrixin family metalloprotease [Bacteroidia bacterium]